MKRVHLGILILSLLCLILAACGGTSPTTATTPASKAPTGASMQTQKITITIGDFYVHSPVTTFTTGLMYQFLVNKGNF